MEKVLVAGLAVIIAVAAVGLYFSVPAAPTAAALNDPGCFGGPPAWGDWNMDGAGSYCHCTDEDVTVNGNIIMSFIDFRMSNCTIRINSSYAGQYGIKIGSPGQNTNFTMDDRSLITYGDNASAGFWFNTTT
ncbi:MAG: hypothetical protein QXD77_02090, partial [Candidatus Aenigmatarchaeota archaeon]